MSAWVRGRGALVIVPVPLAVGGVIVAALVHHVNFVLAGVVRLDREGKGLEDRKVEAVALVVIHAIAPAGEG